MFNTISKIIILLVAVTFTFIWVSDKFSIFMFENQYDLYELAENNTEENTNESKLKLVFIDSIEFFNCFKCYSLIKNSISSFDLFIVKEFVIKNLTPPPE